MKARNIILGGLVIGGLAIIALYLWRKKTIQGIPNVLTPSSYIGNTPVFQIPNNYYFNNSGLPAVTKTPAQSGIYQSGNYWFYVSPASAARGGAIAS